MGVERWPRGVCPSKMVPLNRPTMVPEGISAPRRTQTPGGSRSLEKNEVRLEMEPSKRVGKAWRTARLRRSGVPKVWRTSDEKAKGESREDDIGDCPPPVGGGQDREPSVAGGLLLAVVVCAVTATSGWGRRHWEGPAEHGLPGRWGQREDRSWVRGVGGWRCRGGGEARARRGTGSVGVNPFEMCGCEGVQGLGGLRFRAAGGGGGGEEGELRQPAAAGEGRVRVGRSCLGRVGGRGASLGLAWRPCALVGRGWRQECVGVGGAVDLEGLEAGARRGRDGERERVAGPIEQQGCSHDPFVPGVSEQVVSLESDPGEFSPQGGVFVGCRCTVVFRGRQIRCCCEKPR